MGAHAELHFVGVGRNHGGIPDLSEFTTDAKAKLMALEVGSLTGKQSLNTIDP